MDKLSGMGVRSQNTVQEDEPIKASAFTGLNTVTPIINLPYTDNPVLKNTFSGLSGSMSKRLGTKTSYSFDGATSAFDTATLRTALKHTFVVTKQGQDLKIFETVGDTTSLVMTKTNVFSASAKDLRATTAVTNERQPRVIFATGADAPVQVVATENSKTTSSVGTSFTIQDPLGYYQYATTSNLLVYRNGLRATEAYAVNWAANVLTISSLTSSPSGTKYDVVEFTWQWQGEAFRYLGKDLFSMTSKFYIDNTDQAVAIPEQLRDNLFTLTSTRVYPFYVYKSTDWNDVYTLKTDFEPITADEYHFGSGAIFVPGTPMRVAPNYVTFGALKALLSPPEEVNIIRGRLLPFNGGAGIVGTNLRVYVGGSLHTQSTNTAAAVATSYYLRDAAGAVLTSTASTGQHITFDSTATIGLDYDTEVVLLNVELSDIGSSATTNIDRWRDGSVQPMFGLGLVSFYGSEFHPSSVSTYQGRLVYSGWKHDALHIVASEVWDGLIPGVNFINFDIPRNTGLAVEPVDLQITSYADDYIVHAAELNSSLFVFTRNSVYAIKPTNGILSITGITLSKVANIGLVNSRAMDVVENTILFLSDTGVFDLTATQESNDYVTGERSIKIRNLIAQQFSETNKDTAFLTYNKNSSELYVALPSSSDTATASRLFSYSTLRDSWFEYTTPSGWNLWAATPITDSTEGTGCLLWVTTKYSGPSPNNLIGLLVNRDDYYLDFLTSATGTGAPQNIVMPANPTTTHTTVNFQHEYKPDFDITPFPEVKDVVVTLNGNTLVFGTDYVKRANGSLYLLSNPGAGKTLVIKARRPINDDEVGELNWGTADYQIPVVIVNNVTKQEGVDYTVAANGTVTLTVVAGASIKVGVAYLSIFATPLLTQRTLGRFKRLIHFYGYLNNNEGLDNFTGADVTGAQSPDEIVDRPQKELGINVAIAFDSGFSSELTYDLYGFSSLVWDFSLFDTAAPVQDKPYVLFKEPILGVGYGFQVYFYNWDEKYFDLVGYQVDGKLKGRFNVR